MFMAGGHLPVYNHIRAPDVEIWISGPTKCETHGIPPLPVIVNAAAGAYFHPYILVCQGHDANDDPYGN